jgi:hypothetical protein
MEVCFLYRAYSYCKSGLLLLIRIGNTIFMWALLFAGNDHAHAVAIVFLLTYYGTTVLARAN